MKPSSSVAMMTTLIIHATDPVNLVHIDLVEYLLGQPRRCSYRRTVWQSPRKSRMRGGAIDVSLRVEELHIGHRAA